MEILTRPSAIANCPRHPGIPLPAALALGCLVEEAEPRFQIEETTAGLRGRHAETVPAHRPVDVVARPNAELDGERLRHSDLELAGDLGHVLTIARMAPFSCLRRRRHPPAAELTLQHRRDGERDLILAGPCDDLHRQRQAVA